MRSDALDSFFGRFITAPNETYPPNKVFPLFLLMGFVSLVRVIIFYCTFKSITMSMFVFFYHKKISFDYSCRVRSYYPLIKIFACGTPFFVSRDLQIRMVFVQHAMGIFGIVQGIVGT